MKDLTTGRYSLADFQAFSIFKQYATEWLTVNPGKFAPSGVVGQFRVRSSRSVTKLRVLGHPLEGTTPHQPFLEPVRSAAEENRP